ncbi:tRNA (adenosine(37)-N6)-threonylcarbamoyltransferase complex transferase subunit TsaD [Waddlia chondrophila]|uniref:tRNA N6-adenosine threonylcarbamoyltransferase n=1 Tax=Waddlia chondrophila (strain ATCC VR-1470 / WSU 86-1044) TaxID=716544 RepID=D6YWI4_WADCW|nr:tRNA (adenosine(37)-N6)-threonylcarbamoyltransferase complex transferase subunit TsaD [Waddlia chondrophila]ADI38495.1 O-sialoglycoprotein endopeptidase [Waddlia chondrophila WSU 86-1044]
MLVLGIESTCDETACAVVKDGKQILSNVVASQHEIHAQYGGVFPELASRRHAEVMIPVLRESLYEANVRLDEIDLIAVAKGPGLIGPLLIGLNTAKSLSLACNLPLIGINHIEAHLYAAIMDLETLPDFPCLGVVLSGAHTSLVKIKNIGSYEQIGHTIDDAVGEAFDKVAKMMGLPYPGGPEIEQLAISGDPSRYAFKVGQSKKNPLCFSFSGVKTGVLYTVKGQNGKSEMPLTKQEMADIAASFQSAVFEDIIKKTVKAAKEIGTGTILFGGGVSNSQTLRKKFKESSSEFNLFWPPPGLSLDNGAMIAGLGYHAFLNRNTSDGLLLEPMTRIPFSA